MSDYKEYDYKNDNARGHSLPWTSDGHREERGLKVLKQRQRKRAGGRGKEGKKAKAKRENRWSVQYGIQQRNSSNNGAGPSSLLLSLLTR